jgi:type III secretion system FlhB-like substrate exporter
MLPSIELEHEIPQEMYKAVAEIFAWIYNSQK